MTEVPLDCLIVGAGPAGLTAAIYLARFHLAVRVIDAGHSRAALIPKTRNHAGFPEGISGPNLLRRMNQQARIYGAQIHEGEVTAITHGDGVFQVAASSGDVTARSILLATGVINLRPEMPPELHDELRRRARDNGQSLRDYVLGVLQEEVGYMTLDEWLDHVRSLGPVRPRRPGAPTTAELIHIGREEREAELLRRTGLDPDADR